MPDSFVKVGVEVDLTNARAAIKSIDGKTIKLNLDSKGFTQPLGQIRGSLSEFDKSMAASNARVLAFGASASAIYGVSRAFKEMVTASINVEKGLADININLGLTQKNLQGFGGQIFNIARETSKSFDETAKASAEFARQGLGAVETLKRTRDALILSRLANLDSITATEDITAAINSFNQSALTSTEIVSKFARVDANFAVSSKDLAEAIKRVGSTSQQAGIDINNLIGIVTAAQQTTSRGGAVIGNALKTIFTRLESSSTIEQLRALGVEIDSTQNGLQKLQAIAQRVKVVNPLDAAAIRELAAGKLQINILNSLLPDLANNYGVAARAARDASEATNEANQKNEQLNKTLSATVQSIKTSLTQIGSGLGGTAVGGLFRTIEEGLREISGGNKVEGEGRSVGEKIGAGLAQGLSNFLTGPGAVLITGVIASIGINFGKQAFGALKAILNQLQTAVGVVDVKKQQLIVENLIADSLARNAGLVGKIADGTINQIALEKALLAQIESRVILQETAAKYATSGLAAIKGGGYTIKDSPSGNPIFVRNKTKAAVGLVPEMEERIGALQGGYTPGTIKEIAIPNYGRVIYNTAERVRQFPGLTQPAIIPPQGSKAGVNYKKEFQSAHGFDPYKADGMIPNFVFEPIGKFRGIQSRMLQRSQENILKSGLFLKDYNIPIRYAGYQRGQTGIYRQFTNAFPTSDSPSIEINSGALASTYQHEYGHFIDNLMGTLIGGGKLNPNDIYKGFAGKRYFSTLNQEKLERLARRKYTNKYPDNPKEDFADIFDYFTNPSNVGIKNSSLSFLGQYDFIENNLREFFTQYNSGKFGSFPEILKKFRAQIKIVSPEYNKKIFTAVHTGEDFDIPGLATVFSSGFTPNKAEGLVPNFLNIDLLKQFRKAFNAPISFGKKMGLTQGVSRPSGIELNPLTGLSQPVLSHETVHQILTQKMKYALNDVSFFNAESFKGTRAFDKARYRPDVYDISSIAEEFLADIPELARYNRDNINLINNKELLLKMGFNEKQINTLFKLGNRVYNHSETRLRHDLPAYPSGFTPYKAEGLIPNFALRPLINKDYSKSHNAFSGKYGPFNIFGSKDGNIFSISALDKVRKGNTTFEHYVPEFLSDLKKYGMSNVNYTSDDYDGRYNARERLFSKLRKKFFPSSGFTPYKAEGLIPSFAKFNTNLLKHITQSQPRPRGIGQRNKQQMEAAKKLAQITGIPAEELLMQQGADSFAETYAKFVPNFTKSDLVPNFVKVYHGTNVKKDFRELRRGDIGFHGGTKKAADSRLKFNSNLITEDKGIGKYKFNSRVFPLDFDIKNPLRLRDVESFHRPSSLIDELLDKKIVTPDEINNAISSNDRLNKLVNGKKGTFEYEGITPSYEDFGPIRKLLSKKGYDGIVYKNESEDIGSDSYIAFYRKQIKYLDEFNKGLIPSFGRYHKQIGIPKNLNLDLNSLSGREFNLTFGQHFRSALLDDIRKYGPDRIPKLSKNLKINANEIFEIEDDGPEFFKGTNISKIALRRAGENGLDQVLVLSPRGDREVFAKTVFHNLSSDKHRTLNEENYTRLNSGLVPNFLPTNLLSGFRRGLKSDIKLDSSIKARGKANSELNQILLNPSILKDRKSGTGTLAHELTHNIIGNSYLRNVNLQEFGFPTAEIMGLRDILEYFPSEIISKTSTFKRVAGLKTSYRPSQFIEEFIADIPKELTDTDSFSPLLKLGLSGKKAEQVLRLAQKIRQIANNRYYEKFGFEGTIPNSAKGLIPNFNALNSAIARERNAGINPSLIQVGADSRLKGPLNPAGLGVFNKIDEPGGLQQGISRALSEGRNPKTYNVPNFADEAPKYLKSTNPAIITKTLVAELVPAVEQLKQAYYSGARVLKFGYEDFADTAETLAKQFQLTEDATKSLVGTFRRAYNEGERVRQSQASYNYFQTGPSAYSNQPAGAGLSPAALSIAAASMARRQIELENSIKLLPAPQPPNEIAGVPSARRGPFYGAPGGSIYAPVNPNQRQLPFYPGYPTRIIPQKTDIEVETLGKRFDDNVAKIGKSLDESARRRIDELEKLKKPGYLPIFVKPSEVGSTMPAYIKQLASSSQDSATQQIERETNIARVGQPRQTAQEGFVAFQRRQTEISNQVLRDKAEIAAQNAKLEKEQLAAKRANRLQNFGLAASIGGPLIGGVISSAFGDETLGARRGGAIANTAGNALGFAGLGASVAGLPGLGIGALVGILTGLPEIIRSWNDVLPDLQRNIEKTTERLNKNRDTFQKFFEVTQKLSDESLNPEGRDRLKRQQVELFASFPQEAKALILQSRTIGGIPEKFSQFEIKDAQLRAEEQKLIDLRKFLQDKNNFDVKEIRNPFNPADVGDVGLGLGNDALANAFSLKTILSRRGEQDFFDKIISATLGQVNPQTKKSIGEILASQQRSFNPLIGSPFNNGVLDASRLQLSKEPISSLPPREFLNKIADTADFTGLTDIRDRINAILELPEERIKLIADKLKSSLDAIKRGTATAEDLNFINDLEPNKAKDINNEINKIFSDNYAVAQADFENYLAGLIKLKERESNAQLGDVERLAELERNLPFITPESRLQKEVAIKNIRVENELGLGLEGNKLEFQKTLDEQVNQIAKGIQSGALQQVTGKDLTSEIREDVLSKAQNFAAELRTITKDGIGSLLVPTLLESRRNSLLDEQALPSAKRDIGRTEEQIKLEINSVQRLLDTLQEINNAYTKKDVEATKAAESAIKANEREAKGKELLLRQERALQVGGSLEDKFDINSPRNIFTKNILSQKSLSPINRASNALSIAEYFEKSQLDIPTEIRKTLEDNAFERIKNLNPNTNENEARKAARDQVLARFKEGSPFGQGRLSSLPNQEEVLKIGQNIIRDKNTEEASDAKINKLIADRLYLLDEISAEQLQQIKNADRLARINTGEFGLKDAFAGFTDQFKYNTKDLYRDLNEGAVELGQTLKGEFGGAIKAFAAGSKTAFQDFGIAVAQKLLDKTIETNVNLLFGGLSNLGSSIVKRNASGGLIKGYDSGGRVMGGSGVRDDIPALLNDGEFVIKKSSVNKYGPEFLDKLNMGGIPRRYASGGSAQITLQNEFLLDDNKQPTRGEKRISPLLSNFALSDEDSLANQRRNRIEDDLSNYVKQKNDALAAYKRAKSQRIKGALFSAVIGVAGAGLTSAFGRTAGAVGQGAGNAAGAYSNPYAYEAEGYQAGLRSFNNTYPAPQRLNAYSNYNIGFQAEGGYIKKYNMGGRADSIPALLMGGEYVLNKNTVSRVGVPYLEKLNGGRIEKGYAAGGYVGGNATPIGASNDENGKRMVDGIYELINLLSSKNDNKKQGQNVQNTEGQSIINNFSFATTISIDKNGNAKAETQTTSTNNKTDKTDEERGREMGASINNIFYQLVNKELRPNGLILEAIKNNG